MKNGTKEFVSTLVNEISRRLEVFAAEVEAAERRRATQEILRKLGVVPPAKSPVVRVGEAATARRRLKEIEADPTLLISGEGVDEDFAIAGARREKAARARKAARSQRSTAKTPARRARQKLQGRYMGIARTAPKAVRAKAKVIYAKQGAAAAVKYLEKAAIR
jgi:hypothetical protein